MSSSQARPNKDDALDNITASIAPDMNLADIMAALPTINIPDQAKGTASPVATKGDSTNHSVVEETNAHGFLDAAPPDGNDPGDHCSDDGCTCCLSRPGMPLPGTIAYYNTIAGSYFTFGSENAPCTWMINLIEEYKTWIGFDSRSGEKKALDYAAGTGFLSWFKALFPHVHKILAVDAARNMTAVYNEYARQIEEFFAKKRVKSGESIPPGSLTRATWGHLVAPREDDVDSPPIPDTNGEFQGFSLIGMSLAIDFFASDDDEEAFSVALETLAARLKDQGTMLILDIEKDYCPEEAKASDVYLGKLRNGRKVRGHGSREVVAVLEKLGFKDIAVVEDLVFRAEIDRTNLGGGLLVREEINFMVKATKIE